MNFFSQKLHLKNIRLKPDQADRIIVFQVIFQAYFEFESKIFRQTFIRVIFFDPGSELGSLSNIMILRKS